LGQLGADMIITFSHKFNKTLLLSRHSLRLPVTPPAKQTYVVCGGGVGKVLCIRQIVYNLGRRRRRRVKHTNHYGGDTKAGGSLFKTRGRRPKQKSKTNWEPRAETVKSFLAP